MATERPNIILCMCDELRWCNVGCYGHATCRTPAIDQLAGDGARFDTAVTNNPVCLPARSIVVSGQYSRTCASLQNALWPGELPFGTVGFPQWPTGNRVHLPDPTLPELLQQAGYKTAAIGKWHIEAWPNAVGFDHYVIPAHHHANTAQWFVADGQPVYSPPGYGIDHELDMAEAWLHHRRHDGEPFFLYLNLSPPHMPLLDAPRRYLDRYRDEDVITRGNVCDGWQPHPRQMLAYLWDYRGYRDHLPHCTVPEGTTLRGLERLYMGLTTWVDDAVDRLRRAMASRGFTPDNTLLVFTSDHGDNLGSHERMGKGSINDESCRVPMCMAGPGIEPGTVVTDRVASLIDLGPTCLTLADTQTPDHMPGRDLGPAWRGEAPAPGHTHAFMEHVGWCGLRTPTHTLMFEHDDDARALGTAPTIFHDNTADPLQMTNLAETDAQAALRDELAEAVRAWDAATPWRET